MLTWSDALAAQLALLATIDPQSLAASATLTSTIVDTQQVKQRIIAVLLVGSVTNAPSIDFELQQSEERDGSFESFEPVRKIAQITAATSQYIIELDLDNLSSGKRYIRAVVSETAGATASATVALVLLGTTATSLPAGNLASVTVNL